MGNFRGDGGAVLPSPEGRGKPASGMGGVASLGLPTARNASKDTQSRGGGLLQELPTRGARPIWGDTLPSVPQPERSGQTPRTPVKPPRTPLLGISLGGCPAQRYPAILPQTPSTRRGTRDPNPATVSSHGGRGR